MRRILFVTLDVFSSAKKGGGERYVTELTRALRARGAQVEVAIVRSMHEFAELTHPDGAAQPISLGRFLAMMRRAELIHVHQLNTPGFDYAAFFSKLFRKPLVLTDHGGGALTPGRALGRARLRLVDAAGFVSAWSRRDVDPKGVIRQNAVILGGGDHLPPAEPLPDRYTFGFVGRLLPHKGLHLALEALPAGASLIVAGQARDPNYYAELQRLAQGKRVTFIADASDEIVASLNKSVRYLLVPSVERYGTQEYVRPELLGLVALEALAAGTPVIGSDVGGLGEILRAAGQRVVPPGDVAAWRDALARALVNPAPSFHSPDYTWDAVAHKCIGLYEKLFSTRNGKHG